MVCTIDMRKSRSDIDGRTAAEKIIKVPQMAESISEGTLKQWSKSMWNSSYSLNRSAQLKSLQRLVIMWSKTTR